MDPFIEITKPTLLLNSERARRNIQWMAARAREQGIHFRPHFKTCLLYTSDAADDLLCVDLGGRRIIKTKNSTNNVRRS